MNYNRIVLLIFAIAILGFCKAFPNPNKLDKEDPKLMRNKRVQECCDFDEFNYTQCCCRLDGKEVYARGYDRDCEGCMFGWRCYGA